MAIVEDPSSPATVTKASGASISTASFAPPAGSIAVAVFATGYAANSSIISAADSSGGGNWTQAGSQDGDTFHGNSGVFYRVFPSAPGSITVTGSSDHSATTLVLSVKVLTGCDPAAPLGATAGASLPDTNGNFTQAITPTAVGSMIYGCAQNNDTDATSASPNANTVTLGVRGNTSNYAAAWTFKRNQLSPTLSSVTLGGTLGAGVSQSGSIQLAEFLPGATTNEATMANSLPAATAANSATATASGTTTVQTAPATAGGSATVTDQATMTATTPPASAQADGTVSGVVVDVTAPALMASGAATVTVTATAPTAMLPGPLSASLDALEDLIGTLDGTLPAPSATAGAETVVEGERIVRVPAEDRTLTIPEDRPPGLFYV